MKKPAKKSKAKVAKVRKTDKRQNPSAKKAHQATKPKKAKRTPRAVAPSPREVGLLDAIGEVMAEITDLGQEMRDWADGMPDSKQGGDKHSEVEGAADTLEGISDPVDLETMGFLNDAIKVTIQDPTPRRRGYSRSARLGQATDILNDAITALEEYIGDKEGPNETIAGELKDELDNIESELQGVDFPGMYG